MKDKEKQITEMAKQKCEHFNERVCYKIDCKTQCRYYGKANCQTCIHKSVCTFFETINCEKEVKEYGCKHYQPKIDKDSVVLSREEYKNIYEQAEQNVLANIADGGTSCHWCIKQHEKKASNETAEKILKLVDSKLDLYRNGVIGGSLYDSGYQTAIYDIKRTVKEKLGVEIKE